LIRGFSAWNGGKDGGFLAQRDLTMAGGRPIQSQEAEQIMPPGFCQIVIWTANTTWWYIWYDERGKEPAERRASHGASRAMRFDRWIRAMSWHAASSAGRPAIRKFENVSGAFFEAWWWKIRARRLPAVPGSRGIFDFLLTSAALQPLEVFSISVAMDAAPVSKPGKIYFSNAGAFGYLACKAMRVRHLTDWRDLLLFHTFSWSRVQAGSIASLSLGSTAC
jgi:hypothetical protein